MAQGLRDVEGGMGEAHFDRFTKAINGKPSRRLASKLLVGLLLAPVVARPRAARASRLVTICPEEWVLCGDGGCSPTFDQCCDATPAGCPQQCRPGEWLCGDGTCASDPILCCEATIEGCSSILG